MTAVSVDAVLDTLGRDGYAIVQDMLSPAEVAAARAEIGGLLAGAPTGRNAFEGLRTRRLYAIFAKTRLFDGPATHPLVLGVLDRLLRHYHLSAPTGIEIGPGEEAQALHPDDGIYPLPRPHPEVVVNVMWPLDDFTAANGATRIVPGSHRWGEERPGPGAPVVVAEMPAGSAMFFLGSLWHGGGANTTDRPRLGVIMHYAAAWLRQQESHLLAVPPEVVRGLPERLQELLGYNICPPFIGYVDGRHPRRTLPA
ncbi:ectoine hydroxylase-related dioxygenase (phytanoyl-CoA dioxygenase family) [Thermocatellispora tengchongensis]|uniref:Ectoine hydroxylase-related dioxygenase (Phytanoyl-CoA dioxygenase family) n=1 Tax=Thermocatellispora tengchongensis TaxID=1073253 RepID=A0A840P5L1_9ACTN|nr:phytanoyl-CoA dioxygenase family protein [Thermocatellispora tengchongensis]MBB5134289.1 ectoine hydroxylase-related dioxygenase (phytanoyl-CoA dioxygenase family) [Thermocatellispora tengchongensis]